MFNNIIKITGVGIPTPSSYVIGVMDLTKAGRNAKGTMIAEIIATKRKIELSWNYMEKAELSKILNLVSPMFFEVEYIDPQLNAWQKGTFYVGDRQIGALDYRNCNIRYKDIKFNLIER